MEGVDVHGGKGVVDWPRVRSAGVVFAWVKATAGMTFFDSRTEFNRREAAEAGLHVGLYHCARPDNNTPAEEAAHFVKVYEAAKPNELRPVLDFEQPGEFDPRWALAWLRAVEAATVHRKWLATRRDDYADQVRSRIEPGLLYPATRYCEALAMRAAICQEFVDTALKGVDFLHLPAIPIPVPTIDATTKGAPADVARVIGVLGHCTRGINYLGLPAIIVPAGFDTNGMPVAFQLVGRPFSEVGLLSAVDSYQRVTDWHRRTPAVVKR